MSNNKTLTRMSNLMVAKNMSIGYSEWLKKNSSQQRNLYY